MKWRMAFSRAHHAQPSQDWARSHRQGPQPHMQTTARVIRLTGNSAIWTARLAHAHHSTLAVLPASLDSRKA